jgi:hypothetical protein
VRAGLPFYGRQKAAEKRSNPFKKYGKIKKNMNTMA